MVPVRSKFKLTSSRGVRGQVLFSFINMCVHLCIHHTPYLEGFLLENPIHISAYLVTSKKSTIFDYFLPEEFEEKKSVPEHFLEAILPSKNFFSRMDIFSNKCSPEVTFF